MHGELTAAGRFCSFFMWPRREAFLTTDKEERQNFEPGC